MSDGGLLRTRVDWSYLLILTFFILWPFVNFLSVNWSELTGKDLASFLWIAAPYAAALIFVFFLSSVFLGRNAGRRAGILLSVLTLLTFNYAAFKEVGFAKGVSESEYLRILAAWSMATVVACAVFWPLALTKGLRMFALAAGVVVLVLPTYELGRSMYWAMSLSDEAPTGQGLTFPKNPPTSFGLSANGKGPNVYYLILDGYGRADNLLEYFDFDNSHFLQMMRDLGFLVGTKSYANYPNTRVSVAAMLEMEYVVTEEYPAQVPEKQPFPGLKGRFGKAIEIFRANGYAVILATDGGPMSFGCGWDEISKPLSQYWDLTANVHSFCVPTPNDRGFNQTQIALLTLTPTLDIMRAVAPDYVRPGDYSTIPQIAKFLPIESEKPYLLFAHILLPHLPGRFDQYCNPIRNSHLLLRSPTRSVASDIGHYLGNLQCLNLRVYDFAKRIIEWDEDAIIYITADHGTTFNYRLRKLDARSRAIVLGPGGFYSDKTKLTDELLREMYGILNLARLPKRCRDLYDPEFTPVNSFRLILTCLGLEKLDLLENRHFFAGYSGRYVREIRGFGLDQPTTVTRNRGANTAR